MLLVEIFRELRTIVNILVDEYQCVRHQYHKPVDAYQGIYHKGVLLEIEKELYTRGNIVFLDINILYIMQVSICKIG